MEARLSTPMEKTGCVDTDVTDTLDKSERHAYTEGVRPCFTMHITLAQPR